MGRRATPAGHHRRIPDSRHRTVTPLRRPAAVAGAIASRRRSTLFPPGDAVSDRWLGLNSSSISTPERMASGTAPPQRVAVPPALTRHRGVVRTRQRGELWATQPRRRPLRGHRRGFGAPAPFPAVLEYASEMSEVRCGGSAAATRHWAAGAARDVPRGRHRPVHRAGGRGLGPGRTFWYRSTSAMAARMTSATGAGPVAGGRFLRNAGEVRKSMGDCLNATRASDVQRLCRSQTETRSLTGPSTSIAVSDTGG